MAHKTTPVVMRQPNLGEVDAVADKRKGSAFPSGVAAREARRRRLLAALRRGTPAWDPADHPDIEEAGGAAAWVRKLRRESDRASMRRIRPKRG